MTRRASARPTTRQKLKLIDAATERGSRRASVVAARFVADESREVRVRAFESLSEHGEKRWSQLALRALDDSEGTVVATALECLVNWNVRRAARVIVPLLDHPDELTRSYAAWAIGKLGGADQIPVLRRHFRRVRDEVEGSALAEALFMLSRNTRYLDHLLRQLGSKRPQTRAFTANSLVGVANEKNFARVICALAHALQAEKSDWVVGAILPNLGEVISLAFEWRSGSEK